MMWIIGAVVAAVAVFKYQDRRHTCPKCRAKKEENPHCWVCGEEITPEP